MKGKCLKEIENLESVIKDRDNDKFAAIKKLNDKFKDFISTNTTTDSSSWIKK
jgi:hypothetical protein